VSEFSTEISVVEPGRVLIRGYSHEEIIGRLPYAEAAYLTLVGRLPTDDEARVIDGMLTSLLDHGWVASTITAARYIASGNPQFIPAVAGGILAAGRNTLSPEHSFKLLDEVTQERKARSSTTVEAARSVVERRVARRERIPGLGHPVHRVSDFRSEVLFALAKKHHVAADSVEIIERVRLVTHEATGRLLPVNIDGCLAALGRDLGLTANQVVGIAVLGVLPGLMAHVIEEIEAGVPLRFIRDGRYTGSEYRPLPARGESAKTETDRQTRP
jgi:citrate synthase